MSSLWKRGRQKPKSLKLWRHHFEATRIFKVFHFAARYSVRYWIRENDVWERGTRKQSGQQRKSKLITTALTGLLSDTYIYTPTHALTTHALTYILLRSADHFTNTPRIRTHLHHTHWNTLNLLSHSRTDSHTHKQTYNDAYSARCTQSQQYAHIHTHTDMHIHTHCTHLLPSANILESGLFITCRENVFQLIMRFTFQPSRCKAN